MAEKTTKKAFTMPHVTAPIYFRQTLKPEYLKSIQERINELYPKVQTLEFPITGDEWLAIRTRYPLAFIKCKLQDMENNVVNSRIYGFNHATKILHDWLRKEYRDRLTQPQQQQLDDQTIAEFPEILRIIRDYNIFKNDDNSITTSPAAT